MFKQAIFAVCAFCAPVAFAFAGVELNTADRTTQPAEEFRSSAVVQEREWRGPLSYR
jgi:hypothetical protein